MSSEGSITRWIGQVKAGEQAAAQKLWERYWDRLVRLADRKLQDLPRGVAGEEDVALSAFKSVCCGAARGQFQQLLDRDSLWGLLIVITERKAIDLRRHERRKKRGGGKVVGEAQAAGGDAAGGAGSLDNLVAPEPTPEFAAQMAEEYQRLLDRLPSAELRTIAEWKMQGFTNPDIAAKLDCALRRVERKLNLVRKVWEKEIAR